jgi:hypothetical protein
MTLKNGLGLCAGGSTSPMRAIVTGQVGMDKKPYLEGVVDFAGEQGETVKLSTSATSCTPRRRTSRRGDPRTCR